MRNDRKCDVDFKPGEQMRIMYYSVKTQANSYIYEYTYTCTYSYYSTHCDTTQLWSW